MYTEVKEVVNFLCRYVIGRLPRRPVGIFGAELGNFLVSQFASTWDPKNPLSGESERCIFINCPEGSSKCFEASASESGLTLSDVLDPLPDRIRIFVNPGSIYIVGVENGIKVPLWVGETNADERYTPFPEYILRAARDRAEQYTNLGGAGKNIEFPPKKPPQKNEVAAIELLNGNYVPLVLETNEEINSNLSHLLEMYPFIFVFKPPCSETYTGIDFSRTRFGSSKARQDLQTMDSIKHLISKEEPLPTSTSSSPTRNSYFLF